MTEIPNKLIIFLADENSPLKNNEKIFKTTVVNKRSATKKEKQHIIADLKKHYDCEIREVEIDNCFSIQLSKEQESDEDFSSFFNYRSDLCFYLENEKIKQSKYYKIGINISNSNFSNILLRTRCLYDGKVPGKVCVDSDDTWQLIENDNLEQQKSIEFGKLVGNEKAWKTKLKPTPGHLYLQQESSNLFYLCIYVGEYNVLVSTERSRRRGGYTLSTDYRYYSNPSGKREFRHVFLCCCVENANIDDFLSDEDSSSNNYFIDSISRSLIEIRTKDELEKLRVIDMGEACFPDGSKFLDSINNFYEYCLKSDNSQALNLIDIDYLKSHLEQTSDFLYRTDYYLVRRDLTTLKENFKNKNLFGFTQEEVDKLETYIKRPRP